jgi:site-specific recombinase XerD
MKPTTLAQYVMKYLANYLPDTRGLSTNTIASRRDMFSLLFIFLEEEKKNRQPDIPDLTVGVIESFLDWLEKARGSSTATRNLRLASLKGFFRFVQTQTPDYMFQYQQIVALPMKKTVHTSLCYLSLDGIKSILGTVPADTLTGRRDLVLLSLLYDSAARVQELADLTVGSLRLEKPETVRLTGKGNKARVVPLMAPTVQLLKQYLNENRLDCPDKRIYPLFTNRCKGKLTRAGISYILNKYVKSTRLEVPAVIPDIVSPHSFRHSKAMHLLQAGVPLVYIRDFLGHSEIATTEIYARCDSKQKRTALESAYEQTFDSQMPAWQTNQDLLQWLRSLC